MVNKDRIHVGIDLSFIETGVVLLNDKADIIEEILFQTDASKSYEERIHDVYERFSFIPNILDLVNINIEGLSFGSTGKLAELGALHYFFRVKFFESKIPYKIVPPKELKKFITGKGNAKKEIMIKEVYKKWGVDYNNNNLCDAYSLARYSIEGFKNE